MSRFENLEFGKERGGTGENASPKTEFDHYVEEAWEAYLSRRFEKSLRHYSKLLEIMPADPTGWLGQVRVLLDSEDLPNASSWLANIPKQLAEHPDILAIRAIVAARTGDQAGAMTLSEAAVNKGSSLYLPWLARAETLLAVSDPMASACLEKVLAATGKVWWAELLISRTYLSHRMKVAALKSALCAQNMDPTHAAVWLQAGICQKELGMTKESRRSFQHALELDPVNELATNMLYEIGKIGSWRMLKRRVTGWFS